MGVRSKTVAGRTRAAASKSAGHAQSAQPIAPGMSSGVAAEIDELTVLDPAQLRLRWRNHLGGIFPAHLPKWLLVRVLAYRMQAAALGGLDAQMLRKIRGSSAEADGDSAARFAPRSPATKDGVSLRPGALLVREWQGQLQRVSILDSGFAWNGETYSSLSKVASAITGVNWNGHRFFGLRKAQVEGVGDNPDAP
jgi:hypothetical protein